MNYFTKIMAQERTPMYIKDWIKRLDSILQMNGRELLTHAGNISHEMALKKSGEEYKKYQQHQKTLEREESLKELEEDIENWRNGRRENHGKKIRKGKVFATVSAQESIRMEILTTIQLKGITVFCIFEIHLPFQENK